MRKRLSIVTIFPTKRSLLLTNSAQKGQRTFYDVISCIFQYRSHETVIHNNFRTRIISVPWTSRLPFAFEWLWLQRSRYREKRRDLPLAYYFTHFMLQNRIMPGEPWPFAVFVSAMAAGNVLDKRCVSLQWRNNSWLAIGYRKMCPIIKYARDNFREKKTTIKLKRSLSLFNRNCLPTLKCQTW